MCGIVGYVGAKNATNIVISGLEKLEYRGYDSAGIAVVNKLNNETCIFKEKGRVADLKNSIDFTIQSNVCIGHTRWATHGEPNKTNAHPHKSSNGRFIVVHNGIIENYKRIKHEYLKGYDFYSKTDTEVIANLVQYFSEKKPVVDCIRKTMTILEGSYAILIVDTLEPNKIYFAKKKSPLVIGKCDDGIILASDLLPLVGHTDMFYPLEDGVLGCTDGNDYIIIDVLGNDIEADFNSITLTQQEIDKGSYDHYMLKEIYESPNVIRSLISHYFDNDKVLIDDNIIKLLRKSDQINIVASGTSMYAGHMTKYFLEKQCRIPAEVFCASEIVYSSPLITKKPVFLFLSQSGETADSISVINKYKGLYPIIAMTNTEGSTIARLADYHLPLCAGREIAVASTKTYLAQVALSAILSSEVSNEKNELKNDLINVSFALEKAILNHNACLEVAKEIYNESSVFYIGRGIDYWVSLEAALKLKEVSYIHCEAYPSGELKHGPIALINEGTPIIAIITQEGTNPIVRINLKEAKTRKAKTIVISMQSLSSVHDDIIIPNVVHYLSPLVSGIVVQLIAYYTAQLRNNDIDKPKNLAKCVTVE